MLTLISHYYNWRARRDVEFLEGCVDALPSQDEMLANAKRMRYFQGQLKEAASWRVSRRTVKLRQTADEQLQLMIKCEAAAHHITLHDPNRPLPIGLAERLAPALGAAPSDFKEVEQGFCDCRARWEAIVSEARRAKTSILASRVFFRLSRRNRLEVASLAVGGMIALGALRMVFFYRAAAQHHVSTFWVWDDLVIQAINVVPVALTVLLASELSFRALRSVCEWTRRLGPVLFLLHHPTLFAVAFFLLMMFSASYWGYYQGVSAWNHFKQTGGNESATLTDETQLKRVHLVGTTSRTAIFLQARPREAGEGATLQDGVASIERDVPGYFETLKDAMCMLPFCEPSERLSSDSGYRVYAMGRDKIACHGAIGHCDGIALWNPRVTQ